MESRKIIILPSYKKLKIFMTYSNIHHTLLLMLHLQIPKINERQRQKNLQCIACYCFYSLSLHFNLTFTLQFLLRVTSLHFHAGFLLESQDYCNWAYLFVHVHCLKSIPKIWVIFLCKVGLGNHR